MSAGKKNIFESEKGINVPVRSSDRIIISFTPRVFPTPERESIKEDEEKVNSSLRFHNQLMQWLQRQAEHRRILTAKITENDDLSEAEKNPIWLQKKSL